MGASIARLYGGAALCGFLNPGKLKKMKDYAVFQEMPSGSIICHFRGKKGGCDDVASRENGRYVKHILELEDFEKSALMHFIAFTLKDPNDINAAKKAVDQIYDSLRSA